MRLFEIDDAEQWYQEHEIIKVYKKKHKIDRAGITPEQFTDAMENKHLYPIPQSDPAYLYHGTAKARLSLIIHQGLIPSERSRWSKEGYADHTNGKIFFSTTVRKATFYAKEASRINYIILRVKRMNLENIQPDHHEAEGTCFFTTKTVSPEKIERWYGKWIPLK